MEWGFPGGSEVKASACNAGDLGLIPGWGRPPWRRKWQPTPVFLPGESHGPRSLAGYSPRGRKESDTTERLHSLTKRWSNTQNDLVWAFTSVLILSSVNTVSPGLCTYCFILCPVFCDIRLVNDQSLTFAAKPTPFFFNSCVLFHNMALS